MTLRDGSSRILSSAAWGLTLLMGAGVAFAQSYPSKPVRIILGAPPGGAADATARVVAPRLGDLLGQQIILEPRPGANNNIATEYVARAQPDGYTLLWGFSGALVVNPALYSNLSFNILKDFEPIILIGFTPTVLVVHNSVAANSVPELVALVKSSKPGQFQYSSGGSGSPNHLAAALFTSRAGIDIIHVPYKGGGPAVLALLSDEVKMLFATRLR